MKREDRFKTSRRAAKALKLIKRAQIRDNTRIPSSPVASLETPPPVSPLVASLDTYHTTISDHNQATNYSRKLHDSKNEPSTTGSPNTSKSWSRETS
jgi:hypothetical protein